MTTESVPSVDVETVAQWQRENKDFTLIDIRRPEEYELCRIPGADFKPLDQFDEWVETLNKDDLIVLHCKSGGRSSRTVKLMQSMGFTQVKNLTGGIMGWREAIDPTLEAY